MAQIHHRTLIHTQALDFWLARGAVAAVAALQILMINDLAPGPRWLAPAIEIALLVPLSFATAWNQRRERIFPTQHPLAPHRRSPHPIREVAPPLTNLGSLLEPHAQIALSPAPPAGTFACGPTH